MELRGFLIADAVIRIVSTGIRRAWAVLMGMVVTLLAAISAWVHGKAMHDNTAV
jgi:hypothetical protein